MDHWMDDVVSMMSSAVGAGLGGVCGGGGAPESLLRRVKQEAEHPYSPAGNTLTHMDMETEAESKEEMKYTMSPGSPEQQFCSSTTQPGALSQQAEVTGGGCKDEEAPRKLCLVCGDIASGFHYGVASCEACKAFFKRTIQGNIEYTCPASNECEINKRRRKACQACRFRKCLRTGMLREGVRLDRVRGGRQKYRRAPDAAHAAGGGGGGSALPLAGHYPAAPRPALDDIKILEVLCSYEPDPLSCGAPAPPAPAPPAAAAPAASPAGTLAALADLYDRELVGVIGWAKQIPGFTELQLNDQMRLLQSTWAEMLSLMLAYRSMHAQTGLPAQNGSCCMRLKFATDLTLDEQEAKEIGAHELYLQAVGIVRRLERVSALKEECYLLKALALANSEARLDEHAGLRRFRDNILAALNDAVGVLRPYNASAALQQLLLVLPALRAADQCVRRFWSSVHRDNKAPMNKLFVEMLEATLR